MEDKTGGDESERKPVPPYLPYVTIKTFLERLKVGIPSRVDRSLMSSFSGTVQVNLTNALRYLGLVSSTGQPQERLSRLVNSEGVERQKVLSEILRHAYPFLFTGFDLATATAQQVSERFAAQGASGGTITKCLAFFMAAARDAGIPISPHITVKATRTPSRRRQTAANGQVETKEPTNEPGDLESSRLTWSQLLLSKFPSFDPAWPDEVKEKWFDAFDKLMKRGEESEE